MSFVVGDRVEYVWNEGFPDEGEQGTVIDVIDEIISVRWDKYDECKHSCGELCEEGHGWNVSCDELRLISEEDFELPSDHDVIDFLFS